MKERVLTGSGPGERALPASRRALARPRANRNPLTRLRITSSYPSVNSGNATTKYATTCAGAASVIVVPGYSFRQDIVHDIACGCPRQDAWGNMVGEVSGVSRRYRQYTLSGSSNHRDIRAITH